MTHLSRREFLEQSMFAAAAAAAAGSATTAFAEEQPASTSANERLSVAVIGVKGRGTSHLGAFAGRGDTEVTYICDADEKIGQGRCEEVASRQDRRPTFVRDMREIFNDPNVDIVTTATPNHWHALTSIWAIQAGKDVYVEKPVSHNVSEGRRIVEAARKHGKICQTGTQSRSNPGMREAMAFLHAGGIGNVTLARGLCYKGRGSIGPRGEYQVQTEVDYNLWSGPAPILPLTRPNLHYDWHWIWAYGNGDLGNQGIHQMDLARWGLGVDTLGTSVVSYGGRFGYEDAGETANTQISIHGYGDKTLVFEVRGLATEDLKGAKVGVIYYGSDGYLVVGSYNGGAAFDTAGNMIKQFDGGGDDHHFANFLAAVRSRKHEDLTADILDGHLSSALCHLGNISYRLGSPLAAAEVKSKLEGNDEALETFDRFAQHLGANSVSLDSTKVQFGAALAINPETESFVDNAEADLLLTREYREPFVVPAAGQV
jgi:predicted dehydrogenase